MAATPRPGRIGRSCFLPPCFGHRGVEDCLGLNVYTPASPSRGTEGRTDAARFPVIVWIPGGNFFAGSSNICLYDGTRIASKHGVVVVTINYRVGALGFLGNFGEGDARSGNFGLRDQQRALEWVNEYIEYFGGDPGNVTLWGESSGASSVAVHLVNPQSQQFFHKAIVESAHLGMMFEDKGEAQRRSAALAREASRGTVITEEGCSIGGCSCAEADLECLRSCSLPDLLRISTTNPAPARLGYMGCQGFGGFQKWAPMIEDATTTPASRPRMVSGQPIDIGSSIPPNIPLLIGTNVNEGVGMLVASQLWETWVGTILGDIYPVLLDIVFGAEKALAILQVPGLEWEGTGSEAKIAATITRDVFSCATEHVLTARTKRRSRHPGGLLRLLLWRDVSELRRLAGDRTPFDAESADVWGRGSLPRQRTPLRLGERRGQLRVRRARGVHGTGTELFGSHDRALDAVREDGRSESRGRFAALATLRSRGAGPGWRVK